MHGAADSDPQRLVTRTDAARLAATPHAGSPPRSTCIIPLPAQIRSHLSPFSPENGIFFCVMLFPARHVHARLLPRLLARRPRLMSAVSRKISLRTSRPSHSGRASFFASRPILPASPYSRLRFSISLPRILHRSQRAHTAAIPAHRFHLALSAPPSAPPHASPRSAIRSFLFMFRPLLSPPPPFLRPSSPPEKCFT